MILKSAKQLVEALALPASCWVNQRVPKKLLVDNGAPTKADKRLINDGIEEIQWVAALKPNTIGVAEYRDALREYLEIAVLLAVLRRIDDKVPKISRITELIHRAIPYPLVLVIEYEGQLELSFAHKRWSQNEGGKIVLDGEIFVASLGIDLRESSVATITAFLDSLALTRQSQATLYNLYEGWIDCALALKAARLTGQFEALKSPEQLAARRQALLDCECLEQEALRLQAVAAKETQIARQVEYNLLFKRVQVQLESARLKL